MALEPDLTDEEIADLTDGELVDRHRFLTAESSRLAWILLDLPDELPFFPALLDGVRARLHISILTNRLLMETSLAIEENRPPRGIEAIMADLLSRPSTDLEVQFAKCAIEDSQLSREIDRRLYAMLPGARVGLGLSLRDVGRVAGMHSKFIEEIEQGRRASSPFQGLFERVCTEGNQEPVGERVRRSVWFTLIESQLCRTIRPPTIDPAWLAANDGAVVTLTRSIRANRTFDLLPVLGDALEEAGCVDSAILGHCRASGGHNRGCWVTDAIARASRSPGPESEVGRRN